MASSIRVLPLPTPSDVPGWDETIHSKDNSYVWTASHLSTQASLSEHALCHQTIVCGLNHEGITWTTSLVPHRVCRVASTRDLVAVSMNNGTVGILKASTGDVLATRRVAPEGATHLPASVIFVDESAILVEPPEDLVGSAQPILVSHMNGNKLNSEDNGVAAEAARSMVGHALPFASDDIRAIIGTFLCHDAMEEEQKIIRFVMVTGSGELSMSDYHIDAKTIQQVSLDVPLGDWEIDYDVGLRLQKTPFGTKFVLFSAYRRDQTKLVWVDLVECKIVREHLLPKQSHQDVESSSKRTRILAVEPLVSATEDSLAVLVTLKNPLAKQSETLVLQAIVKSDSESRSVSIGHPHLVYRIPVPPRVQSVAVAPLSHSSVGPFSFRCKTWMGGEENECLVFSTDKDIGCTFGRIRLLIQQNQLEEARDAACQVGVERLVQDSFSQFHTAEIELANLRQLLSQSKTRSPEDKQTFQECLTSLVESTSSQNEHAKQHFLSAIEAIQEWPATGVSLTCLSEIIDTLRGVQSSMTDVKERFESSETFSQLFSSVEERMLAMQYLQFLVDSNSPISDKFLGLQSPQELFTALVENQQFLEAEEMWRSGLRGRLTIAGIVSSVVKIPPSTQPRQYGSLLKNVVFPNLTINHELLPPLLAWACVTADGFDDMASTGGSLDDSIFLLETVERSTKDLRLRIHSSFSHYTPFVYKHGVKRRKVTTSACSTSVDQASLDISVLSTGPQYVLRGCRDEDIVRGTEDKTHTDNERDYGAEAIEIF